MRRRFFIILPMIAVATCIRSTEGPPLQVGRSVTLARPPAEVWAVIGDFGGLARWHPGVASASILSGTNNSVGAIRLVTLKDGGTIREELTAYDSTGHSYSDEMIAGDIPVREYRSTLSVKPAGGGATVTWAGTFRRKDPSPNPGREGSDAAAIETIAAIYAAGLDNLKTVSWSPNVGP
jgi:mxaD protein